MYSRVLVVGDCHLKLSRIDESKEFLKQLLVELAGGNYNYVIFLGDQFDTFAVIRSEIMTLWNDFIDESYKQSPLTSLIMIVGNHDYAGNNGGTHALASFKSKPNVLVIDEITDIPINGVKAYFVPFTRDAHQFERLCLNLEANSLLFCHQTFNGSKLENGFYAPEGADPDCVKHLSRVIVGHVHHSQSVGENIWYPGTPFQQSFSEAGQKKAIFHMSIGNDLIQKCQLSHAIQLDMPTFEEVKMARLTDLLYKPNPNTSYKIKGTGTPQEIAAFKNSVNFKEFVSGAKKVIDDLSVIREITPMQDLIKSSANKTTAEKIQDFISSRNWKSNKEVLIERARNFLSQ